MSAADNERLRQKRREAGARGLCTGCRVREAKPGGKQCATCIGYSDAARDRRLAEGKCHCGRERRPGRVTCQTCADRAKLRYVARAAS